MQKITVKLETVVPLLLRGTDLRGKSEFHPANLGEQ